MAIKTFVFNFFLFFLIFFPTFFGGISLRQGQAILYIFYPALLFLAFLPHLLLTFKIKADALCAVILAISIATLFSIWSKLAFVGFQIVFSHLRYISYLAVYVMAYNLALKAQLDSKNLLQIMNALGLAILAFVIAQILAPDLIDKTGISNRSISDSLGIRIGGPMIWSYSLGFILTPIIFGLFGRIMFAFSFRLSILLMALLVVVVGGQSKASYLAYFLNFILLLSISFRIISFKRSLAIFSVVATALAFLAFYVYINIEKFGNILRFLGTLSGNDVDASTQTRLNQLSVIRTVLENHVWLGFPRNYIIIENAYGHYFYFYGLLGVSLYAFLIFFVLFKSYKTFVRSLRSGDLYQKSVSVGLLCFAVSVPIFSLSSAPLDGHKSGYFYWTFIAISFAALRRRSVSECGSVGLLDRC